jgi:hypothetical protein
LRQRRPARPLQRRCGAADDGNCAKAKDQHDLLHDRRVTPTALADRIGMTLANLSILKTGKARAIRFLDARRSLRSALVPARRHSPL